MKTRILIIALLFSVTTVTVFAQDLTIIGRVIDQNNTPIDAAEVLLFADNKYIASELTAETGEFTVKNLVSGNYFLLIRQLGDSLYSQTVQLTQSVDLGTLTAKYTPKLLQEITITGRRPFIENKGDRLVFNVASSIFATGTNVTEILKNIPKIDPTSENLKIIGKSNVLIMINDRLLNLDAHDLDNYLNNLRSDNIAKIEVITNPPAKYDAAGNTGLINIVLKNNTIGFDGSVTGTYVQRTKPGFMPSGNFTYSTDKLSIGLDLFADQEIRTANSTFDVIYPVLIRNSKVYREDNSKGLSSNLNIDYNLKKSHIGLIMSTDNWDMKQTTESKVNYVTTFNQIDSTQNLPSNVKHYYNYFSISPYYDLTLDTLGKKLKFNYNYLMNNSHDVNNFLSQSYEGIFENLTSQTSAINNQKSTYKVNTFNVDLELPFKQFKIETGAKYSYFSNNSDIKYYDTSNGNSILDENQSNQFIYNENIYAAYFSIEKQWNEKFYTKAGMRYEGTKTKGNSLTADTAFTNTFNDLFPDFSISYNPNASNSFSLGYNKRIDRPVFYEVNPFRMYADAYNYSEGNPLLEPSITHNVELTYILKSNFTVNPYISLMKNGSDWIIIAQMNSPIIVSTPQNYIEQKTYGLNMSYNWHITKNWGSYNSFNLNYNNAESKLVDLTIPYSKGYGSFVSTRNNYKIGKNYRIYVNYVYIFPSTYGFWKFQPKSILSMGGVFNFPKQNLNLNVSFNDVLRQSVAKGKMKYPNFIWKSNIYNDMRSFQIALTYNFGNKKSKSADRQIDDSEKSRIIK